jgi:hypothetical protein
MLRPVCESTICRNLSLENRPERKEPQSPIGALFCADRYLDSPIIPDNPRPLGAGIFIDAATADIRLFAL